MSAAGGSPRERAAQAIIAAGEEARAAVADAAWMRRRRHGDPTAEQTLLERACLRLALPPAEIAATLATEPALAVLLRDTIARAVTEGEHDRRQSARLRVALLIGIPVALVVCVGALLAYRAYQDDPKVKQRAAQRAAQDAAPTR